MQHAREIRSARLRKPNKAELQHARKFAALLETRTWEQAKAAMGEHDTCNSTFRTLLKKYGLWQPRFARNHSYIPIEDAAAMRAAGLTYTCIAQQLGCTRKTVRTQLRQAGKDTKPVVMWGRVDKQKMVRLYAQGWPPKKIAEHFGVTVGTVYGNARRAGVRNYVRRHTARP
jgi:DNA-binding CsgD family transcriptional regulator